MNTNIEIMGENLTKKLPLISGFFIPLSFLYIYTIICGLNKSEH